jgi:hypothetical protein
MNTAQQNERELAAAAEIARPANALRVGDSFLLPLGYVDPTGQVHREVQLRSITGLEQQLVSSFPLSAPSAQAITELLTRCVKRIGKITAIDAALIQDLLVGDREYLLLKLYQITFGGTVYALWRCPSAHCAEVSEVPLQLEDFHIEAPPVEKRTYWEEVGSGHTRKIPFRLPTGGDQEALAGSGALHYEAQTELLIERCLLESFPPDEGLSKEEQERIAERMQTLAPLLEVELEATCPKCSNSIATRIDVPFLVLQEIKSSGSTLDLAIHTLAFHYHWSESEILSLTPRRRERYLDLLQNELESAAN